MERYEPLVDFFEAISEDARIRPVHISLYMALLEKEARTGPVRPLVVTREELMQRAKISARATYYRGMRELDCYGYIRYQPSYDPSGACIVYLRKL